MSERRVVIDETAPEKTEGPIRKNPNGTIEVMFSQPIKAEIKGRDGHIREEEYTSACFRSLSFGDIKALANNNFNNDMMMVHWLVFRLSNLPEEVFDMISGDDMTLCIEAISDFLPKPQKT